MRPPEPPPGLVVLIPRLAGKRILVVGDICLDEYIVGRAQRLSREAPVPVLELQRRFTLPGAAANPARNVAALGGKAFIAGLVGDDEAGQTLRQQLAEYGVAVEGVLKEPGRSTTLKTRVLAEVSLRFPQQMLRVDQVQRREATLEMQSALLDYIRATLGSVDAVLVSDYKNGLVTEGLVAALRTLAAAQDKLVTVDSQGDLHKFVGFTVVKCNREDAEATLRVELSDAATLQRCGDELLERLKARALLITLGSEGMSLLEPGGRHTHIPASNLSEVYDVTGAGDTVIAVFTLVLAAGGSLLQAMHLANYAAGLVVRKLGNATVTPAELSASLMAQGQPLP